MFLESGDISFKLLSVLDVDRGHSHAKADIRPFHALSFRVMGNARFTYNQSTVTAESGDIVFVPAYARYWIDAGKEHLFVIHFQTEAPMPERIKKFRSPNPDFYLRECQKLYASWMKKPVGYEHECQYLLHRMVMQLEREAAMVEKGGDRLTEALSYIHEHFNDRKLSVEELARMCSMSDTYFRRLFTERYSVTPLRYIQKLKTQYAVELLKSNYYTVSEVAEQSGFENLYYFSTFIKKETGQTPSQIMARSSDMESTETF